MVVSCAVVPRFHICYLMVEPRRRFYDAPTDSPGEVQENKGSLQRRCEGAMFLEDDGKSTYISMTHTIILIGWEPYAGKFTARFGSPAPSPPPRKIVRFQQQRGGSRELQMHFQPSRAMLLLPCSDLLAEYHPPPQHFQRSID